MDGSTRTVSVVLDTNGQQKLPVSVIIDSAFLHDFCPSPQVSASGPGIFAIRTQSAKASHLGIPIVHQGSVAIARLASL